MKTLIELCENWYGPEDIEVSSKKNKEHTVTFSWDDDGVYPLVVNLPANKVFIGEERGTHGWFVDNFRGKDKECEEQIGCTHKELKQGYNSYETKGCPLKFGRYFDFSEYPKDIRDLFGDYLYIAFWCQLTGKEAKQACDLIVTEILKNKNHKPIKWYYLIDNNRKLVKRKYKSEQVEELDARSEETTKQVEVLKAIHLATQKEKEEFFKGYKAEVAAKKENELQTLGIKDGTYAKRNNMFTKKVVFDPETGKYKTVYAAKIGDSLKSFVRNFIYEHKQFTVYIMMGMPGSGKSTWIEKNLKGIDVVSRDITRAKLGFTKDTTVKTVLSKEQEQQVSEYNDKQIEGLAKAGKDFVIDDINLGKYRGALIAKLRKLGARIIGVHIDTPLDTCIARRNGQIPDAIMKSMYTSLQPFKDGEVDKVIKVTNTNEAKARKNDKGEDVPEICPSCGGKIGLYIKGEPVWLCEKCQKYFGTLPFNG